MRSTFVHNGSVAIHTLESGSATSGMPSLLVIGGVWEPAERAIPVLSGLSSHAIALSLRGRGLSSTPLNGYDVGSHLSDIEAVVKYYDLHDYCVLGFSRGASYALGWSLEHQREMRGLILVDQPPMYVKPNSEYVNFWSCFVYQGVPILNFMRLAALQGMARDSEDIDYSSRLSKLQITVKLFAGKNKEAKIPSDISDKDMQTYQKSIPGLEVVEFQKSGHMIPDEEQAKYIEEIQLFLRKISVTA